MNSFFDHDCDAAGFSLSNNPDTMENVVQNVIDDALASTNAIMTVPGLTAFYMFIKSLLKLYLIFDNWF